jgi:hypothetical protein
MADVESGHTLSFISRLLASSLSNAGLASCCWVPVSHCVAQWHFMRCVSSHWISVLTQHHIRFTVLTTSCPM